MDTSILIQVYLTGLASGTAATIFLCRWRKRKKNKPSPFSNEALIKERVAGRVITIDESGQRNTATSILSYTKVKEMVEEVLTGSGKIHASVLEDDMIIALYVEDGKTKTYTRLGMMARYGAGWFATAAQVKSLCKEKRIPAVPRHVVLNKL